MGDEQGRANDTAQLTRRHKRRGLRRWLAAALIVLAALLAGAELFARFYLGLGDPPLSMADAEIEYLFKPSQDIRRFGNRIYYNAYSMRSDEFPPSKADPRELRVMIIGDSVVNGGALTDQSQIATSILQQKLREKLSRPVIVGNISAGSWGPVNMLAYVKKYGLFDADVLVIVLSSHDYCDVPAEPFTPVVGVQPDFPDRKPLLAVQEGVMRYLLPRLGVKMGNASIPSDKPPEQGQIDRSLRAARDLIELARSGGAKVIVAQYLERQELETGHLPGHELIQTTARQGGASVVQLGPLQQESLRAGKDPYRDRIHPNAAGQGVIAEGLLGPLLQALDEDLQEPGAKNAVQGAGTKVAMDRAASGR